MTHRPPAVHLPEIRDIPALVALFQADLSDLGIVADPSALVEAMTHLLSVNGGQSFVRVVRDESSGEAVGVIVAHRWHSITFLGPSYWIESLYVDPVYRRKGQGRALVEALLAYAVSTGVRGIDLEAYRMNAPAGYLYRALGFQRLGRERYSLRLDPTA